MLRLNPFEMLVPRSLAEAAEAMHEHAGAMIVAGGTDAVPKMKRGQFEPRVVISLAGLDELKSIRVDNGKVEIGAMVTLRTLEQHEAIRAYGSFHSALTRVATPNIRNAATLGGNLLQDTRCRWYDRSHFWRDSIGYCMKKGSDDCKVAPGGRRCYATFCSDLAPALAVIDAQVTLSGGDPFPIEDLYRGDDGMDHVKTGGKILVGVMLGPPTYRATYRKLRIRGGFDFPEIGVAAAVADDDDGMLRVNVAVSGASTGVQSFKKILARPEIATFVDDVYSVIKPMDTMFFPPAYRRKITRRFLQGSLDELLSA